jgi:hypothetical protein
MALWQILSCYNYLLIQVHEIIYKQFKECKVNKAFGFCGTVAV